MKDVFLEALDATIDLMVPTAIVTLLIGIPSGVVAALHRDTALDRGMMVLSVFGYAVPNFFMGVLLLLVFSIWLGWPQKRRYSRATREARCLKPCGSPACAQQR